MLTIRQQKLLANITENYIKTAEPVASGFLAEKKFKNISSATVRNEMAELEAAGYIFQPHTSAGRMPTEKAYEHYVENYATTEQAQNPKFKTQIKFQIQKIKDRRQKIREIAKWLAKESGAAVIAAFSVDDNYYTGLSNLFSQPEFKEQTALVNISELIEKFDTIIKNIYPNVSFEPGILIGKRGHFGESCSFIAAKAGTILIGILGPIRMDYKKNYQLIKFAVKLISE